MLTLYNLFVLAVSVTTVLAFRCENIGLCKIEETQIAGFKQKCYSISNKPEIVKENVTDYAQELYKYLDIVYEEDGNKFNILVKVIQNLAGAIDKVLFKTDVSNMISFKLGCDDNVGGVVNVLDVNNQPPEFNKNHYEYTVTESFPQNLDFNILDGKESIIVWDRDFPPGNNNKLQKVEILDDDDGIFDFRREVVDATPEYEDKALKINIITLFLKKQLNYEHKAIHNLILQVSDGKNEAKATITINVRREKDLPPKFENTAYQAVIDEKDVKIYPSNIKASDPGSEMNNAINYTIDHQSTIGTELHKYLTVDKDTGAIKARNVKELRDSGTTLIFVKATKTSYPYSSTNVPVYLRFKPEFDSVQYDVYVWNTAFPKVIFAVNAGGNFIYKLKDVTEPFTVTERTGEITMEENGMKDQYEIKVEAGFPKSYKIDDTSETTIKVHVISEITTTPSPETTSLTDTISSAATSPPSETSSSTDTISSAATSSSTDTISSATTSPPSETSSTDNIASAATSSSTDTISSATTSLSETTSLTDTISLASISPPSETKLSTETTISTETVPTINITCDNKYRIFEEHLQRFTIESNINTNSQIGKLKTLPSFTDLKFAFSKEENEDSKFFVLNEKTGTLFTSTEFNQEQKNLYIIRVNVEATSMEQEKKTDEGVVAIQVTEITQPPKFCRKEILVGITKDSLFGHTLTILTPTYSCSNIGGQISYELSSAQGLIHIDKKSGQLFLLPNDYENVKSDKPIEINVTATYNNVSTVVPLKVYFPNDDEIFIFQIPLASKFSMSSEFCSFKTHISNIIKGTDIGIIRKELHEDGKKFLFYLFAVNGTDILSYGDVASLTDIEAAKSVFGEFTIFSAKQLQQQESEIKSQAVDADSSLTAVVILAALLFVSIVLGFLIWYRNREEVQRMNSMTSKLLENEESYHTDSPKPPSNPSTSKHTESVLKFPYNEESSTDWFMPMVGKRETAINDEIVEFANHLLQLDGDITVDMFLNNNSKDNLKNKTPSENGELRKQDKDNSLVRGNNTKPHSLSSEDNQQSSVTDGHILEASKMSTLVADAEKGDSESPLPLKAIIRMPDQPNQQPRRRSVVTFNDQPEVIRVDTNEAIK